MRTTATTADAYRLVHEGTLALAEVEENGVRIDVARLDKTIGDVGREISEIESELRQDSIWQAWKKRYGSEASLGSRPQLAKVLFEDLGIESKGETETGRPRMDEEALGTIDVPFVKGFMRVEKLKKLRSTYLNGIKRELVGEYIRPVENTHLVRTYRSSVDSPNIQNQINRDQEFSKLLRQCYIPRDGHVITECDYGRHEWQVAACWWRDENMIEYASDPTRDIHRDIAALCYMLPESEVPKGVRSTAKNSFVFPQLYGSDYIACSANLWFAGGDLKTNAGVDLITHLRSKGITILGKLDRHMEPAPHTFERHIRKVEQEDFKGRFPQWAKRKDQWWNLYLKRGWFDLMTGFRCSGVYSMNELMNYVIQGPAFHCLLWSLPRMIAEMKRRKMRSKIIAQIHDSIVGDVHKAELDDYFELATRIMSVDIRQAWSWIVVPLVVECEVAEPTWYDKRRWEGSLSA